jgi:hypothetical protein
MQSPHLQRVSRLSQRHGLRRVANQRHACPVRRVREAGSRSLDPEAEVADDVALYCVESGVA